MDRCRLSTLSRLFWPACVIFMIAATFFVYNTFALGNIAEIFKVPGACVEITSKNFKILLMPEESQLRKLNKDQLQEIFTKYTNSLQLLCNQHLRVGVVKDGGKEVCADDYIVPRDPCIVYSFGSNNEFGFDQQVVKRFGCQVHTFDHTMDRFKNVQVPKGVTLHDKGLSGRDQPGEKLYTLDTIMADLHHEEATIDILKMDIEKAEWLALEQMMASGSLDRVKQLLVEFHFLDRNEYVQNLGVFRKLYEYGFRTFSRERNTISGVELNSNLGYEIAQLIEMSFINMKYI